MNEDFLRFVNHRVKSGPAGSPVIVLESQLRDHPAGRFSIYAADPHIVLKAYGEKIYLTAGGECTVRTQNPWEALKEVRSAWPGWYLGYLGYDLKNSVEKLDSANRNLFGTPDLFFIQPRTLLVYDHYSDILSGIPENPEQWYRNPKGGNGSAGPPGTALPDSGKRTREPGREHDSIPFRIGGMEPFTSPECYLERIRRAKEWIREGEFYEVNLSHVLQGSFSGNGFDLYRMMKEKGPVPFAAYMSWDGFQVCSASPERFLCRNGDRIVSQPIKGTAARLKNREEDEKMKADLCHSEKERAENLMIVDLVRHDLSRISLPGSVRVPELFSLQSFETVHQLVSTVEGRVEPDTDSVDILKSCFPMGSMTGAPKIRSMQAIEELEDYKRGIYSGAIGYIRPDGDFDFNVVIRTAILNRDRLFYPVGGAVTSDSDPEKELEETMVKAQALTVAAGIPAYREMK